MTPELEHDVCDVPVFYATTEGQTRRIAERIAEIVSEAGLASRAIDVSAEESEHVDWSRVRGAALGASLHIGRYQSAADRFVTAHADDLNAHPSLFFGVSLAAASEHPEEVRHARDLAEAFADAHHWHPAMVASFAGRLAYTQYGFLKRRLMKWIAKREGGPTDTSRDYELTNWMAVEALARGMAAACKAA